VVKPSLMCSVLLWLSKVTVQLEAIVLLLGFLCPLGEPSTGDSSGRTHLQCYATDHQRCSLNSSEWTLISFVVAPGEQPSIKARKDHVEL